MFTSVFGWIFVCCVTSQAKAQTMATRKQVEPEQHWIVQFLPLNTLKDGQNLALRFQEGKAFRLYVLNRIWLVIPVALLILVIGIACTASTVVFFAGLHPLLALPAIVLLLPIVLIGSLFVQLYVFFSWLENRAMASVLGRRTRPTRGPIAAWLARKWGVDMGQPPPVPWVLAAIVLLAPLVMLASFAWVHALALIALGILAPFLYALFDG